MLFGKLVDIATGLAGWRFVSTLAGVEYILARRKNRLFWALDIRLVNLLRDLILWSANTVYLQFKLAFPQFKLAFPTLLTL